MTNKNQDNNILYAIILILILAIVGLVAYVVSGKNDNNKVKTNVNTNINASTNNNKNQNNNIKQNKEEIPIKIISDKRCPISKCGDVNQIAEGLKQQFSNAKFDIKDFSEEKDYIKTAGIKALPAIIFKSNDIDPKINPYLIPLDNGEYSLNIGATFDPFAEICGNGIDDDNNGKTDCEDETCKSELACAPKVDKPKAELYVMSYCPYGTQAQKGYLQVLDKLGKVADVKVKFVNYLMHGKKEGEQNLREYCIQKEQSDKFHDYLQCFLKEGDNESCLKETNIDKKKLETCVTQAKKDINYDVNLADKTRRFPKFSLQENENNKYGIQGSPTFVLNGQKVEGAGRSAKAYADLICNSFKEKPKECDFDFDSTTYDPNFGFTSNGQTVSGGCGG